MLYLLGINWNPLVGQTLQHGLPKKAIEVRLEHLGYIFVVNMWMCYHMYIDRVLRLAKEADDQDRAADPGTGRTGEGETSLCTYTQH